jgi:hypothetical protein
VIGRAALLAVFLFAALSLRAPAWDEPLLAFVVWMTYALCIGAVVLSIAARRLPERFRD